MQKLFIPLLPIAIELFFFVRLVTAEVCNEAMYPDQNPFGICSYATAMIWDWDNSTIQLGASSSGTASVTGGQGPYIWTISGNGFYLDEGSTVKSMTTDNPAVTIYTSNACGPCDVTVTDACGKTIQNAVRSETGRWVEVSNTTQVSGLKAIPHTDFSHVYLPCADEKKVWCMMYSSSGPTYEGVGENGRYRVSNWRWHKYYGSTGEYGSCDAAACSSTPPGFGQLEDVPGFPTNWCWAFGGNPPFNCDFIKYRWVSEWRCN